MTSDSNPDVIVVGGGIAGRTAAYTLQQAALTSGLRAAEDVILRGAGLEMA